MKIRFVTTNWWKLKQQTCLLVWWLPEHSQVFTSSVHYCSYWERLEKVLAKVDAKTGNMKVILKDQKKIIIQQMHHFTRRREVIFCVECFLCVWHFSETLKFSSFCGCWKLSSHYNFCKGFSIEVFKIVSHEKVHKNCQNRHVQRNF